MKVVVVYNPKSGSSVGEASLKDKFESADINVEQMIPINRNISSSLRPYLERDKTIIAVCGGDGTINSVAGILAGTKAILAPLPGGTLNHFTKDLGIEQDLDKAIANLHNARPRHIDIAKVNDKVIINNSSIGLYPAALRFREDMPKSPVTKWFSMIIASIRSFIRNRTYSLTIGKESVQTPLLFVGNNDYGLEHGIITARKHLDQGLLSVYAITSTGRLHIVKILLLSLVGMAGNSNDIKIWKTDKLVIRTPRRKVRVSTDGEHEKINTPLRYEIMKKSLLVIGGK